MARGGLFQSYHCDLAERRPAAYADADGLWYGFGLRARSIAYNTLRVPVDRAPRSLEALLDEQWRGRIVMARPEFGTPGGDVGRWVAHYGPERAMETLKSFKAHGPRLVSAQRAAVRPVAYGRAALDFGLGPARLASAWGWACWVSAVMRGPHGSQSWL